MTNWVDVTEMARQGVLDPVIGRDQELDRIIQVLLRRTRNNPLLVGAPGVGKTALVEGLAQRIVSAQLPAALQHTHIYACDLGLALAHARASGEVGNIEALFAKTLMTLQETLGQADDTLPHQHRIGTILFVDELHLLSTRVADGAAGVINLIKLALSQRRFAVISETTPDHYQQYRAQTENLDQFFHAIPIAEPSIEDTVAILQGLAPRYAAFHQVTITDEAVRATIDLATRYLPQRALPDKAVDLLDESAGRVRSHERAQGISADQTATMSNEARTLTRSDVEEVVAIWTGLPLAQLVAERQSA
jgi:ATP-dependent Clp protease ATP-binding subunit ClpB